MNNKNFINMTKKTVFVGKINGETFDNVAAYNARLQELINSGVAVEASSETKVNTVEAQPTNTSTTLDVQDTIDEDLTIYPYMCEDDPFYLDLLVTDDPVTNQEAYTEAQNVLKKCYDYTNDVVSEWCPCDMKSYVEDIDEILSNIDDDIRDTMNAFDKVGAKRKKLEESYHRELDKLNKELDILHAADRVSDMFKNYYSDVRENVLHAINNYKDNCNCNNCNNHNDDVETTVTEKTPQTEFDFNKLLNVIFGPDVIRARR
jgi:hypothetical protein